MAVARRARVFARADSACLMESCAGGSHRLIFASWRVLLGTSTGQGESIKCLRPAVFRSQAPRGKANTAGASGLPVLSAGWCVVVDNEGDRGREKPNIKDGMFGHFPEPW